MRMYFRIIGVIALSLWISALALPAVTFERGGWTQTGYDILKEGWIGPIIGQFGWYANPLMLLTILCLLVEADTAFWLSAVAFLLAMTSLTWTYTVGDGTGENTISQHHSGFYIWIACATLLFGVALTNKIYVRPRQTRAPRDKISSNRRNVRAPAYS